MSITTYNENTQTIGDPNTGCRHCGEIVRRTSANGRVIIYHPGTTCCPSAIRDQIRYRENDYARLKAEGERILQTIDDLEAKANRAIGKEQTELLNEANKARAAYERHTHSFRQQTDGDGTSDTIGLKNELRELRAQLHQLESRHA